MGIIARQGIKGSIVTFIGVGIGAVIKLFILTKLLDASQIGLIETISKIGMLISPFFILGAASVVQKYFVNFKNDEHDGGLIASYTYLMVASIVVSSIVYIVFKENILAYFDKVPELEDYIYLPLLVAIAYVLFNFLRVLSLLNLRITVPNIFRGVFDRLGILVCLVIYGLAQYGYWNIIDFKEFVYLYVFAFYLLPLAGLIVYILKVIKPKIHRPSKFTMETIFRATMGYNLFLILSGVSDIIVQAIDVNMISSSLGLSYSGVYVIAFYIGAVIDVPKRNIVNITFPILNDAYHANDMKQVAMLYKKTALNQFLVGLFMFSVIWFSIDEIFKIIPNGEVYKSGKLVVLYIGIAKLIDQLTGVNKEIIDISKYYKYNLFIGLILSISVIVFNLYFIHHTNPFIGGINGIAFATLLAMLISNIYALFIVWKKEGILPFSWNLLKCLIPFLLLIPFAYYNPFSHPILSIIYMSLLCGIVFLASTYYFRISEDFILILQRFIKKK